MGAGRINKAAWNHPGCQELHGAQSLEEGSLGVSAAPNSGLQCPHVLSMTDEVFTLRHNKHFL